MTVPDFLALLVVGLCGYRLARLVTKDTISDPFRAWVWARAYSEGAEWDEDGRPRVVVRSNGWRWLWLWADCPFCVGVYTTVPVWWAWTYWHAEFVRPAISCVAAIGVQAMLSSRPNA